MNTAIEKNVDDPQAFDHRFAAVNGIRLHYVEEGQGPLVILLHGYPFLWYLWRHQIKVLAAAGYRVVALDQRGYGQSDCPEDIDAYDITHLVGDVVGLIKALDSDSAVLVGQDWGSPVAYNTALMRPDLVRGLVMMCSPPSARGAIRPSDAMKAFQEKGIEFYQSYIAHPEAGAEIMRDVRRFLLGLFYSTSGYCPADKQWRWAWKAPETFSDTYTVPETLPAYLSQQALDYYVAEFTRNGIQPAHKWYAAIDAGWAHTSFLDGATVRQPALFLMASATRQPGQCSASTGKAPLSIRSERISAICGTSSSCRALVTSRRKSDLKRSMRSFSRSSGTSAFSSKRKRTRATKTNAAGCAQAIPPSVARTHEAAFTKASVTEGE